MTMIIGVAGGTASGKSTVCRKLVAELGDRATLITHDRYYFPLPPSWRTRVDEYNFDHPDALETTRMRDDLMALKAGKSVKLPRYDFTTQERSADTDEVKPVDVIVIEGILVLWEERLRDLCDHTFFVHVPADIRLMRRIRRDMERRGRGVHHILDQYEKTVRPSHERFIQPSAVHATHVLDGTRPIDDLVEAVRLRTGLL